MARRRRLLPQLGQCAVAAAVLVAEASASTPKPFWPLKNGNLNRSGASPYAGPWNLERPSWTFQEPDRRAKRGFIKAFHSSPILDEEKNIYIVSTTGHMYSLDQHGRLRWSLDLQGTEPGNPALVNGTLFTAVASTGVAYAVEAASGRILWSRRIGLVSAADTFSAGAVGDIVLLPVSPEAWRREAHKADFPEPWSGTEHLVALRGSDGEELWRYDVTGRAGTVLYNAMPAIVGDFVVFADFSGGLFKVTLAGGKEVWHVPGPKPGTWSTAGLAVGPNGVAYAAFNVNTTEACNGEGGVVVAHDLETGRQLWSRYFGIAANAAPAVGRIAPDGRLAVVVGIGDNPGMNRLHWFLQPALQLYLKLFKKLRSPVFALDAFTGEIIWTLELEPRSVTLEETTYADRCAPDIFSNPTISSDGIVYINWSSGSAFAIKDANGDGRIDPDDPNELSRLDHGDGSNGASALAPGLLVAPSCLTLFGYNF